MIGDSVNSALYDGLLDIRPNMSLLSSRQELLLLATPLTIRC